MARIPEHTKLERLRRVEALLRRSEGLTEREISETLNFDRRTVNNYLRDLETQGRVEKDGPLWYALARQPMVLRPIELQPEEAMTLYLAARLFVKHSDKRNEAAENVLVKLAEVLSSDAGVSEDIYHAAQELANRPMSSDYEDIFRTMMRAYLYRRQMEIVYHPYRGRPFRTTFSPYLLEPSAIGFATYAIGYSSVVDTLRTYKIERIAQAELLRSEYVIPADFPGVELLRNAWSIYYGEQTVQVVLRFHPSVAKRVQETYWHPSQQLTWDDEREGYLLATFEVADTTDLLPWIRTWGANCEVVAPQELRESLSGEARRWAYLYGWRTSRADDEDKHARFADIFGED